MNIAIIGTGNIGGTLAKAWARAGHRIYLGVRNLSEFKGKELLAQANITAHPIADAVAASEVIFIAAVPTATASIVASLGEVSGKVIIDAMNSVRAKPDGYENTFEAIKELCSKAEVVKCFNSTGVENLAQPLYPDGTRLDMYMAASSTAGKDIARQLALDAGFEACIDFGGDDKVALLEQFALAWINLAMMQGMGRGIGFKLHRR
jgi:hypothetical protein